MEVFIIGCASWYIETRTVIWLGELWGSRCLSFGAWRRSRLPFGWQWLDLGRWRFGRFRLAKYAFCLGSRGKLSDEGALPSAP